MIKKTSARTTPFSILKASQLLLFLLILAAFCGVTQAASFKDKMSNKTKKQLNDSINEYVIVTNPDVQKYCDNDKITRDSIAITEAKRQELRLTVENRYKTLIPKLTAALDDSSKSSAATWGFLTSTGAGISLFFMILALVSLVVICMWSFCEDRLPKACCKHRKLPGEDVEKYRFAWLIGISVVGVATLTLAITWVVYLSKAINRAPEVRCATAIVFSDLMNGTNLTETSRFIGSNGVLYMIDQFYQLISKADTIEPDATNLINMNLIAYSGPFNQSFKSLNSSFNPNAFLYPGTITPSVNVMPGYINNFKSYMNTTWWFEVLQLALTANAIDGMGHSMYQFATNRTIFDKVINSLNTSQNQIDTVMVGKFVPWYNEEMSENNNIYIQSKTYGIISLIIAIVDLIVLNAVFLVLLVGIVKYGKFAHWSKIAKGIMSCQMGTAFFVLLFAILSSGVSVSLYFVCNATNGMITQQGWIQTNLGNYVSNPNVSIAVDTCVHQGGNGSLLTAFGFDWDSLNDIADLCYALQAYVGILDELTLQPGPVIGGQVYRNLTGRANFSIDDVGVPPEEDILTGLDTFNKYGCAKDSIWKTVCPVGTAGKSSDASTAFLGQQYCVMLNNMPSHFYSDRYGGGTTSCATTTWQQGQAILTQTAESSADYVNSLNSFINSPDFQGTINNGQALFDQLKGAKGSLTIIKDIAVGAIDTLNDLQANLDNVIDCRVARTDIAVFENVACYRFGNDFYHQTNIGVAVGILLFFYSWGMCFGIRIIRAHEEEEKRLTEAKEAGSKIRGESEGQYKHLASDEFSPNEA